MNNILNNMVNTVNAIKRGYIEITEEEYNILKKETKSMVVDKRDIFNGASCLFMGIRVYVKGKDHVKN